MPAAYPRERASVPRLRDLNRLNVSCRCTRVSVEAGIGQLRNQLVFSGLCCQLRFRLRMNSEDSAVFARFSARRSLIDWAGFFMFLPGALSAIVAPHFSKWQSQTDLDHTSFTEKSQLLLFCYFFPESTGLTEVIRCNVKRRTAPLAGSKASSCPPPTLTGSTMRCVATPWAST